MMRLQSTMIPRVVPLLLDSRERHPDGEMRSRLAGILEPWIEAARPALDRESARKLLEAETGTDLEPFVLGKEDLAIAVDALRLAFSGQSPVTAFRIVSGDNMGSDGGLEIALNGFAKKYRERYARGAIGTYGQAAHFFAPYLRPYPPRAAFGRVSKNAHIAVNGDGIAVTIKLEADTGIAAALSATEILQEARVAPSGELLKNLGLDVRVGSGKIQFRTKSPEAMILLDGLCHKKAPIMVPLEQRRKTEMPGCIHVQLRPVSGEKPVALACHTFPTSASVAGWMSLPIGHLAPLELDDDLAWWLGPGPAGK